MTGLINPSSAKGKKANVDSTLRLDQGRRLEAIPLPLTKNTTC
jgi:hypothetical protein